jgi:hypothetical protein
MDEDHLKSRRDDKNLIALAGEYHVLAQHVRIRLNKRMEPTPRWFRAMMAWGARGSFVALGFQNDQVSHIDPISAEEKTMGMFSDLFVAEYNGHKIEVEGKVTSIRFSKGGDQTGVYALIIDNKRVDEVTLSGSFPPLGTYYLRGNFFDHSRASKEVRIAIRQGFFGCRCKLEIDGREHRIKRIH